MSGTVTFLGQTFNRDELSESVLAHIDYWNSIIENPDLIPGDHNDFIHRMNQAVQMFGDTLVGYQIQEKIDEDLNQ